MDIISKAVILTFDALVLKDWDLHFKLEESSIQAAMQKVRSKVNTCTLHHNTHV
jgi:hypothetical protein